MKILFLNIYQGIVSRGAENFVYEVSRGLSKKNKVDVFSNLGKISEEKARSQTPLNLWGKILYKLSLDAHSRRVLIFTLSLLPKISKGNYDWIVPVDGGWQVLILKLVRFLKRGKFKILISGQAGIGRDDLRNLRLGPDVFVALSKRAESWAKEINQKTKVVYIPNGADLEHFNPKVKPVSLKLQKPIIICVAGMNPYKRVDLSIKAVAGLEKGSLLVLGDGPIRGEIEALGDKLLGPGRFLRTTVLYEEMSGYYTACDLFTLVSASSEGFGSAYIEAMAAGLPVVATDDQIRREIIGGAGLFIDPTDTATYTQALREALGADWKGEPRKQAEKFSWGKITSLYEAVIN